MTKYVYHAEQTNSTCENCKKHNKEVYYDIKDIPKLPIHPNCKCWIETIEEKDNNKKCDCKERFEILENNLYAVFKNSKRMSENIQKNIIDIEENIQQTDNIKNIGNIKLKNELHFLLNEVIELQKEIKILDIDATLIKEYTFNDVYHLNEECKSKKGLEQSFKRLSILCGNMNAKSKKLKYIHEKHLELKALLDNGKKIKTMPLQGFTKPVEGNITSDFGYGIAPTKGASSGHSGIDINASVGTPVRSIADGVVISARGGMRGYGIGIFIDHGIVNKKHVVSEYGHLSEICAKTGDKVKKGQVIAKSGNTGISTGPHLHLTIRENGVPIKPQKYIGGF